jgi:hypothetical protein
MKAYIRVDSHPFHGVTDARGRFVIENVPVGSYQLDVWHERLGSQSLTVGTRSARRGRGGAAGDPAVRYPHGAAEPGERAGARSALSR